MPSPDPPPLPPKRAATFATSSQTADPSPSLRARGPRRQTSAQSLSSSHSRSPAPPQPRRSSTFSLSSIDELSQSLADDLINPSFTRPRSPREEDDEVTNWHSTPLLFALLPAVGGVLFKEGAAVVTDLLILGSAAIFLNWSVRLPWDWYYASQVLVREARGRVMEMEQEGDGFAGALVEEDEHDKDDQGGADTSDEASAQPERPERATARQDKALADLRSQETLALLSTFLSPALAAYLLHVLRCQLSKPSTGLVSDYNLSIFLLVAEIRPCRQLIRLIKRRTLHLQRTISGLDGPSSSPARSAIAALTARLEELEHQQSSSAGMNGHTAKTSQLDDLSTEMKRRYESRIDALERAVRRYEKRTTTLAMVTEQRLKILDTRLSDTLSLAAVAAQQSRQRGAAGKMVDAVGTVMMLPVQVVGMIVLWPFKVLDGCYARARALVVGKPKGKSRRRAIDEKGKDRSTQRKLDGSR